MAVSCFLASSSQKTKTLISMVEKQDIVVISSLHSWSPVDEPPTLVIPNLSSDAKMKLTILCFS